MRTTIALLAALAAAPLLASPARATVVDRVAAVVDEEVIALSEVYELGGSYIYERCQGDEGCIREMELEVLDALVRRSLIRGELIRLQMQVTGEEIDQAIDRIVAESALEDREALRSQLEAEGTRWDVFREEIAERLRTQRFQQRVVAPRVIIQEDEIRDLYQRTVRKGSALEAKLSALGIIVPPDADPDTAATIIAETEKLVAAVNAGQIPWEEAVAQYDQAGLAQIVGGRTYRQGQLTGPIDELAFAAEPGIVQAPVRVGNVLFIVRVDERGMGSGAVPTLDEMREQLRDQLFQEKVVDAEEEWYQRARRQATVDILLENT